MRALICEKFAPYHEHQIQQVSPPDMQPTHVRLAIKAAGVNFPDMLMIQGQYQIKPPFPFIAGAECAGIITEIGDQVREFKVGDRVASLPGTGCFAEEAVVPANSLIKISDKMPFTQAAGFIMVYGTTYHALKQRARLKAGETLLVLGAAGGVGLSAVELGAAMGANVIAAASHKDKLAICQQYGARHIINYSTEDLKARAKELTDGGADIVYDPVGDKYSEPALRAMAWQGRYLVIGFAAGDIPRIALNLILLKSLDVRGVHWGAWVARAPDVHAKNMRELMAMYETGTLRPHVSHTYSLENFTQAFTALKERRVIGKVILTMD